MTNGVPEWLTLIIAVYGSVIGTFSLFLYFIKLRREKPHLTISTVKCSHTYTKASVKAEILWFNPLIRIENTGDRGTTVSKVELAFRLNNTKFIECTEGGSLGDNRIKAHGTLDLRPTIKSYNDAILDFKKQERIECAFTLFHTHGKKTRKSISEISM
ncbi:MAG: hypothetical protein NWE77_06820 [Candidatus Bathyarchaeota archaeon]|nr:hypothetical protein [Candidatus Bathyarchaeota archaeon]